MGKKLIFITGGQRSGKSSYAQNLAFSLSDRPVYLATSRIWDEEHRRRIERHKADRGGGWTNVEEEKQLANHDFSGRVVLVDCVTLWLTNFFFDSGSNVENSLVETKAEFEKLMKQEADFIFVSNEIGLGGMSPNEVQRKFSDLQGWMNQYIAAQADEVVLMVSGIPVKIR